MGTCSKEKGQHRKRNRHEIEYGLSGNAVLSLAEDGTCGEGGRCNQAGSRVRYIPHRKGEPLEDSGKNTEEVIWKQQPEKTYFVSVVIFELELCRRVDASLDQTSFDQASVMLILQLFFFFS